VPRAWPHVERLISGACDRSNGRFRPQDILNGLLERDYQLWVAFSESENSIKAVGVTEVVCYRSGLKLLVILMLTGQDREQWTGHMPAIQQWGREQGCTRMLVWARPGWEREMTDFKRTHIVLEAAL